MVPLADIMGCSLPNCDVGLQVDKNADSISSNNFTLFEVFFGGVKCKNVNKDNKGPRLNIVLNQYSDTNVL